MTEAEWLTCGKPEKMLKSLKGKAGDRKPRLFAVACCRRSQTVTKNQAALGMLAAAEGFADGLASPEEVSRVARGVPELARSACAVPLAGMGLRAGRLVAEAAGQRAYRLIYACYNRHPRARAQAIRRAVKELGYRKPEEIDARDACLTADDLEQREQAALLRCIFGNPFWPVTCDPAWLAWNGGTIPTLARTVYEERSLPSGHLDPVRLALLADMLEDAGCSDSGILDHLRGPGPHVRGCWVVDLLLGKG